MGAVFMTMVLPTVAFGLFAVIAVRFGAESRPYFDEQPVVDDRPNWFPIARSVPTLDEDDTDDGPHDGEAVPVTRPARPKAQPRPVPVAAATSAATSPSGV